MTRAIDLIRYGTLLVISAGVACRRERPVHVPPETHESSEQKTAFYRVGTIRSWGTAAVHAGRASLHGGRRYELIATPPSSWSLLYGDLDHEPKVSPLPLLDDCALASIAAFEEGPIFSCERTGSPHELVLLSSDKTGDHVAETATLYGQGGITGIWPASEYGDLLIVGASATAVVDDTAELPPLVRGPSGEILPIDRGPDHPAIRSIIATRFDARGDLYVLADDTGGDTILLTMTSQGDVAWRSLPSIVQDGTGYEPRLLGHSGALHIGNGGELVVLIREDQMRRWIRYVSRDAGATLEGRLLTIEADSVDLAGARGLAYDEGGDTWETNDAGATWRAVPPPPSHAASQTDVRELLACAPGGCLIDTTVTRVGWSLPKPAAE